MQYGWWMIGGHNLQAQYGYGSQTEAEAYCNTLNAGREINLYGVSYLGQTDAEAARASNKTGEDLREVGVDLGSLA